jgi:hypothetical protein
MTDDKLREAALDELMRALSEGDELHGRAYFAIKALRAALAEPSPAAPEDLTLERVAYAIDHHDHHIGWDRMCSGDACAEKMLEALR